MTNVKTFEVFVHNNGYSVGDWGNDYGGTFLSIPTNWRPDKEKFGRYIAVSLSLEIETLLEDGENYCNKLPVGEAFDFDRCLGNFYESKLGCSIPKPFQGHVILSDIHSCNHSSQYEGKLAFFFSMI